VDITRQGSSACTVNQPLGYLQLRVFVSVFYIRLYYLTTVDNTTNGGFASAFLQTVVVETGRLPLFSSIQRQHIAKRKYKSNIVLLSIGYIADYLGFGNDLDVLHYHNTSVQS
jgi:hypothetical protein